MLHSLGFLRSWPVLRDGLMVEGLGLSCARFKMRRIWFSADLLETLRNDRSRLV